MMNLKSANLRAQQRADETGYPYVAIAAGNGQYMCERMDRIPHLNYRQGAERHTHWPSVEPFIYAADFEDHAVSFALNLGMPVDWADQYEGYLLAHGLNPSHQHNVIGSLCSTERTICREIGHDWIEEGDGGPDSGWIGATCQRCGESHHTTLY